MSAKDAVLPRQTTAAGWPWQLWMNQLATIIRRELAKNVFTRRGLWIYLLAFAPTFIIGGHAIYSSMRVERECSLEEDTNILAAIFQYFYLRFGIYFGCVGIFTRLFRGEVVDKSLHYYFLAPVRREVLVAGKYVAGVITAALIFGLSVFVAFAFMYGHFGAAGQQYVFAGPGLWQLGAYLGVTLLACIGYGAIFLLMGLIFKNPILPTVLVLLWETINVVLPSLLKKLSVIFYLKPLCPVDVPAEGGLAALFTVVAEPVAAWIAVPGLLILSAGLLVLACRRIRKMEISYSSE